MLKEERDRTSSNITPKNIMLLSIIIQYNNHKL